MEPLVECHSEQDLDIALSTDAKIIESTEICPLSK